MFTKYFEKLTLNGKNYLYNLRTGYLLVLDDKSNNKISEIINNHDLTLSIKDRYMLKKYGFLVPSDKPIYSVNKKVIITIGVTKKCNCDCEYCFERKTRKIDRNESTKYNFYYLLMKYISFAMKKNDCLEIIWYGGEPSISIDEIMFISKEINQFCMKNNKQFDESMVTNGLLLNAVNINKVKSTNISRFQITLDGPERYHNLMKKSINVSNLYRTVITNIKLLIGYKYKVTININVDKNNKDLIIELLDDMNNNELINNDFINIRFSRIINTSYEIDKIEFEEICMSYENYLVVLGYKKFELRSPSFNGYCQADYNNFSVAIDNHGNIYNCIEEVFDGEKVTANLENIDWVNFCENDEKNHSMSKKIINEKCNSCKYLPFCRGLCPLIRNQEYRCVELIQKQIYREVSRYVGVNYEKNIN